MGEMRPSGKDHILQVLFEGTTDNEEALKCADAFLNGYINAVLHHVLARIFKLIATVGPLAPRQQKLATFESVPIRDFLDDFSSSLLESDVPLRQFYYNLAREVAPLSIAVAQRLVPTRRRGPRRELG